MADIVFQNPGYLWLLIAIPLIIITHFFLLRHLKTRAWKFSNFEAIRRVTGASPSTKNSFLLSKNYLLLLIKVFILLAMILSIAGPVLNYFGTATEHNFVLAIDASSSMLADDFDPNRFVVAKKTAIEFIDSISGSTRVGLVSFAGVAYAEKQLTDDKRDIEKTIATLNIKKVGGTDLGAAIITSVNILMTDDKPKSIILLTDGRSTVGTDVMEGIDYARANSVSVFTIGVATTKGGSFLRLDALSTLDEKTLKQIADMTGGKYFAASDEASLRNAFQNIAAVTQQPLSLKLRFPFILLALALIFVEWGLINTRYRTLP
ncbi:MAG: VWA domain-containing protein [DPANN group archaeon]|nr:VWA domain-containing protein [DPANN group archaeon]